MVHVDAFLSGRIMHGVVVVFLLHADSLSRMSAQAGRTVLEMFILFPLERQKSERTRTQHFGDVDTIILPLEGQKSERTRTQHQYS